MDKQPLVSVCVITYNSTPYIIETLDSIVAQTYKCIELVITDDSSTDNTIMMCRQWLKNNSKAFVNSVIVTSDSNSGISANINRGVNRCNGDWIKIIAGDDLLVSDCIERNLIYTNMRPKAEVVLSLAQTFYVNNKNKKIYDEIFPDPNGSIKLFPNCNAREQYIQLLHENCLAAPTQFWKATLLKTRPYNEIYRFEEDYEQWINLTKKGIHIDVFLDVTVMYRISQSISRRAKGSFFNRNYMQTRSLFFWNELFQYFREENLLEPYQQYRKRLLMFELTEAFTQNKRNIPNAILLRIISFLVRRFAKYTL